MVLSVMLPQTHIIMCVSVIEGDKMYFIWIYSSFITLICIKYMTFSVGTNLSFHEVHDKRQNLRKQLLKCGQARVACLYMMEAFTISDMMCHHKVVRCLENDVCDKIISNLMVALIKSPVASRIKTYATLLIVTWYQGQIVYWQVKWCHWELSYPGKTADQP